MWAAIPSPPDEFFHEPATFDLTAEEAHFVAGRIRVSHPDSLLADAASDPGAADTADWPWETSLTVISPAAAESVRHAHNVSELTLGPQLVYNLLLARRARVDLDRHTETLEDDLIAQLELWSEKIAYRRDELLDWVDDLDEFWRFLELDGPVRPGTKSFITNMMVEAARDPYGLASNAGVADQITLRERRLKGARARLTNRAALEAWNGQTFGGQLDFRWGVARNYLADLASALRAPD